MQAKPKPSGAEQDGYFAARLVEENLLRKPVDDRESVPTLFAPSIGLLLLQRSGPDLSHMISTVTSRKVISVSQREESTVR